MIDQIFWWLGFITFVIGAFCGLALLAWLAGNAWIDASRKWRLIFRAENNIIDYIHHRTEFERWKREQEALKDAGD